jgi:serine/threonine protein kinase
MLAGLHEMWKAGIKYHHDLKPKNIIIDRKTGAAKILDCGHASADPLEYEDENGRPVKRNTNKGYGTRDLPAIAQIAYKMETGRHLFSESETMETTTGRLRIRDEREHAYASRNGLRPYLKKVRKDINDKEYANFLVQLLSEPDGWVPHLHAASEKYVSGVYQAISAAKNGLNTLAQHLGFGSDRTDPDEPEDEEDRIETLRIMEQGIKVALEHRIRPDQFLR